MNMKHIALALSVSAFAIAAAPAMAAEDDFVDEQKQECRQVVEQECEAGAYGQTTSCKQKAEQVCEQKQKIVVRDKVLAQAHVPVDTALDLQTALAVAGLMTAGAGSFALRRRIG